MTVEKDIIIVGAGHMGHAIALGLKRSNKNMLITAIDPNRTYEKEMKNAGISVMDTLPKSITSNVIILAIPPQAFVQFAHSNSQFEHYTGMTISVMAGINLSKLVTHLKTSQVCRAIPNLPCATNEGMSVLMCTSRTTQKNKHLVNDLFLKLGTVLTVRKENLIDAATALVGGGPAYISYFAQALIEYALLAGFDEANAYSMVIQTLRGTSALLDGHQESPARLYEKVMTPKGTTEQAINFFDSKKMQAIVIDGLKHANARSRALGRRP